MARTYRHSVRTNHSNGQHTNPRNYAGVCATCHAITLAKVNAAEDRYLAAYDAIVNVRTTEDHSEAAFYALCDRKALR